MSIFTAMTPEEIERKLKRQLPHDRVPEPGPSSLRRHGKYNVEIYNPDSTQAIWLFAHVFVGSGDVDATIGTFLLNEELRESQSGPTNPVQPIRH